MDIDTLRSLRKSYLTLVENKNYSDNFEISVLDYEYRTVDRITIIDKDFLNFEISIRDKTGKWCSGINKILTHTYFIDLIDGLSEIKLILILYRKKNMNHKK